MCRCVDSPRERAYTTHERRDMGRALGSETGPRQVYNRDRTVAGHYRPAILMLCYVMGCLIDDMQPIGTAVSTQAEQTCGPFHFVASAMAHLCITRITSAHKNHGNHSAIGSTTAHSTRGSARAARAP